MLIDSIAWFVRIFTYVFAYAFAAFWATAGLALSVVIAISVVSPTGVTVRPDTFGAAAPSFLLTSAPIGPE